MQQNQVFSTTLKGRQLYYLGVYLQKYQREWVTWVRKYPVDAKSGRSNEQAASTEVIPAAVPSTVFSVKWESYTSHPVMEDSDKNN